MKEVYNLQPRKNCKDMWNAFMVKNAFFDVESDMPICISTNIVPASFITYEDALAIYRKEKKKKNLSFHINSFIVFYIDDQKFDGKRTSIWTYPNRAYKVIKHFDGIITPDFSTFSDFPDAIKRYNTYRMRAFGCWMNALGIPVINNVRWGTYETWSYCFSGIPRESTVAIGSVASGIRKLSNRPLFEEGLKKMVSVIKPRRILIYGSANYPFIQNLRKQDIEIISIPSKSCLAYKEVHHEQVK